MKVSGWWAVLLLSGVALVRVQAQPTPPTGAPAPLLMEKLSAEGLENLFRVQPELYSGGQPTEQGFAELAKLGVKTVISVDGAAPDVELAHHYGLRYVHLPISYGGVPEARQLELAKALKTLPGPVYVHCHHGKHRGPAATLAACRGLDSRVTGEAASAALQKMGTATRYKGLYESVRTARVASNFDLARIPAEFPESVAVPAMVQQMVALDAAWERWLGATDPNSGVVERDAVIVSLTELEELLTEAGRLLKDDAPVGLKSQFEEAARHAKQERERLVDAPSLPEGGGLKDIAARLDKSCNDCHAKYR